MSPKEKEDAKVEEFKHKTELTSLKEKEVKVQFDGSWPHKGLILRIKITKESGKHEEIEMTKKNVETRCKAAYYYLRRVLPAAREKVSNIPQESSVRKEADEILSKIMIFMDKRGLSIT